MAIIHIAGGYDEMKQRCISGTDSILDIQFFRRNVSIVDKLPQCQSQFKQRKSSVALPLQEMGLFYHKMRESPGLNNSGGPKAKRGEKFRQADSSSRCHCV
jgi:hypothetical protein